MSAAAQAYLAAALAYMQENSVRRDKVDWAAIRAEASQTAAHAQSSADTYDAIAVALYRLGDQHSRFVDPQEASRFPTQQDLSTGLLVDYAGQAVTTVRAGSPADRAGVRQGDIVTAINGTPARPQAPGAFFAALYTGTEVTLTLQRPGSARPVTARITHDPVDSQHMPQGRRLDGNIGYVALPSGPAPGINDEYAAIMQQIIRVIDRTPTCGWVVDLQHDQGGALDPMVLGVGPILGDGEAGASIPASGPPVPWSYREGIYRHGTYTAAVAMPYALKQPFPPVAVLTSRDTASAGEAVAISFRGRAGSRSFGAATAGVPTGNSTHYLSDGAAIILTTALEADRTGHVYGLTERIAPDQLVANPDPRIMGTDADPVLRAAVAWLQTQPGCDP
jgi:C-terminal processing protease CtpA/Prc